MFPVYIHKEDNELPTEGIYYVVASNGTFLHKDNGLFKGFVKVDRISCIDDFCVDRHVTVNLPPVPHEIVMKVKRFFSQVFVKHYAEAVVLLYYNQKEKSYLVFVPEQQVSHVAVMYKREPLTHLMDYIPVGTIHSHCDFNAFHSAVDEDDEKNFDGLHITFGDLHHSGGFSITASVVLNGQRSMIDPTSILEGIHFNQDVELYRINPPAEKVDYDHLQREIDNWMAKVN